MCNTHVIHLKHHTCIPDTAVPDHIGMYEGKQRKAMITCINRVEKKTADQLL